MLPYSRGIILDNTSNYGIVKTEAVFGFGPSTRDNYVKQAFNATKPLEWIFADGGFEQRTLPAQLESRRLKAKPDEETSVQQSKKKTKKQIKSVGKKKKDRKGKGKGKGKGSKCIYKIIKSSKTKNKGANKLKKQRKYILPLILGLLAAKSLLIPIALKALAFLSAKGLMMGFFSTVMASVLSLKGMFDHSHGYQNRKDDTKTQVEIIQVPSKSEDHVYYDEHYKRGDLIPVVNRYDSPMEKIY